MTYINEDVEMTIKNCLRLASDATPYFKHKEIVKSVTYMLKVVNDLGNSIYREDEEGSAYIQKQLISAYQNAESYLSGYVGYYCYAKNVRSNFIDFVDNRLTEAISRCLYVANVSVEIDVNAMVNSAHKIADELKETTRFDLENLVVKQLNIYKTLIELLCK